MPLSTRGRLAADIAHRSAASGECGTTLSVTGEVVRTVVVDDIEMAKRVGRTAAIQGVGGVGEHESRVQKGRRMDDEKGRTLGRCERTKSGRLWRERGVTSARGARTAR